MSRNTLLPRTARAISGVVEMRLSYRQPFDWEGILRFLSARAVRGVEDVTGLVYTRTARVGGHAGVIRVRNVPGRSALAVELTGSLAPARETIRRQLRALFDLDARPGVIAASLGDDPRLAAAVSASPGRRVPGAFDGFELAVRAILGQQVSVKAATTIAGRYAEAFGEAFSAPGRGTLTRLTPTAERIAGLAPAGLAELGIIRARAGSIIAIARAVASGRVTLNGQVDPEDTIARLVELPGIGPWTAHYIAMRALHWADAFPKEDLVVRRRLGGVTAPQAEVISQAWRPWRSYATMHIWQSESFAAR